jgi:uncharacterized protein
MIERMLTPAVKEALAEMPAVCLLGPRQVGKTTLALKVAEGTAAVYLDLESEQDRAKLTEPELYLEAHLSTLVILDEVHRTPGIFAVLRGLIDRARRAGVGPGQYLLLGSASPDLLRQSAESLAGRVRYLELAPFTVSEPTALPADLLWLRGGFPQSLLASSDPESLRWRRDFIRTYLERDIPQLGPRMAAETLRRFWTMLAHAQGGMLNAAALASSLGIDARTTSRYVDLLVDLFLLRRLPPWHANVGKRLVKSPKVYVRDTGLMHALLGIGELETLLGHPTAGPSWEAFVIENLLGSAPDGVTGHFYRTSGGAEIDLLLLFPDGALWAVEIKRSLKPRPNRGFHVACSDLSPARRFLVYPGAERFSLGHGIAAVPLAELLSELQHAR